MNLPEPQLLGDPVDSDPTSSSPPHLKAWEEVKKVQVTPDTVTTLAHGGTDGLICVELGYPHMHVDRWPGQANGREVEVVVTSNNGELGPVTHSFPPSHQGGCGTIKRSNHH